MDATREPEYQDGILVTDTDYEAFVWMWTYSTYWSLGESDAEALHMANVAVLAERTTLVENLMERHDANE